MRQEPFCIISASMNATQCRMARAALRWSVDDLAQRSGIAARSIARFENGEPVRAETLSAMSLALVAGGAAFIETNGKRGVLLG